MLAKGKKETNQPKHLPSPCLDKITVLTANCRLSPLLPYSGLFAFFCYKAGERNLIFIYLLYPPLISRAVLASLDLAKDGASCRNKQTNKNRRYSLSSLVLPPVHQAAPAQRTPQGQAVAAGGDSGRTENRRGRWVKRERGVPSAMPGGHRGSAGLPCAGDPNRVGEKDPQPWLLPAHSHPE